MSDQHQYILSPKLRPWRYLPFLILMGLAVHLLLPQIATLEKSWGVIKGMAWWAIGLAFITQCLSYLGSGFILHAILANQREQLSVLEGVLITLASSSIGLVAGGWLGGSAATYGWVQKISRDRDTAVVAGTLPSMLNNLILAAVALIGTIYLLVIHDLSKAQFLEFSLVLLVLSLLVFGIWFTYHNPKPATHFILWLNKSLAQLRKKPFNPQGTLASLKHFGSAWGSLRGGRWRLPVLGAIANVGFDMLTLYLIFVAAGAKVSPGVLFAGYGLPLMLAKLAFFIPGGVGVVETSLAAFFTNLDIPASVSVVVVLGYRLISFWLPSLLGFIVAAFLGKLPTISEGEQA